MSSDVERSAAFFKALAHPSRLLILGLCRLKPRHTEELAGLLQLSNATVSHHLSMLVGAGLLDAVRDGYYQNYRLKPAALERPILEFIASGINGFTHDEDPFRAKVLRDFFKHGRLQYIPAQRKKRAVVLQKIAESFEPDQPYQESEVNAIITEFHEDFATIRRELVGMDLLERANGVYKRVVTKPT
jgi:hypothetical protein